MCLYAIDGQFEIRVADRDIVVWKVLEIFPTADNKPGKQLYSPYYRATYIPGKTKRSVMRVYFGGIDEGLHAFITLDAVKTRKAGDSQRHVFPAVIPAGSKFAVGGRHEIASTALIVYRTMADLEKVHGKVAEPVEQKDAGKLLTIATGYCRRYIK